MAGAGESGDTVGAPVTSEELFKAAEKGDATCMKAILDRNRKLLNSTTALPLPLQTHSLTCLLASCRALRLAEVCAYFLFRCELLY
eukprot:TRINITY_DN2017_c0_g1_i4.p1 TRINITY_DN2017_c0_g1~~TRINITY_DN2017_c0_g1_i4.p1  ORF type:complete len:100 (-),score=7.85 TRINITY_DN2017_c0_g1_i4:205-462(-)